MKPKLILGLALVLSLLAALHYYKVWPFVQPVRVTYSGNKCINNLEEINWAKDQWASEQHKTTNDTPTWNDLIGHYMKAMPVCQNGGTYTIGRVGELPTCSKGNSAIPPHIIYKR